MFQDECSFVSLRDVERVLTVMSWFYNQSDENGQLFADMDRLLYDLDSDEEDDDDDNEEGEEDLQRRPQVK